MPSTKEIYIIDVFMAGPTQYLAQWNVLSFAKLNLSKEGTAFPNSSNVSRTALVYLFVLCSVFYFLQL